MATTVLLNPLEIKLDIENPRFSLFNYQTEDDIINHLIEFESVKELALQMINNGYMTLGERLIVLESETKGKKIYTVLEGNRRVAALKCIFTKSSLFSTSDRELIKKLDIRNFYVECDLVKTREDATFKIAAKHIDGIKSWKPTDKLLFYYKLFSQYLSNGLSNEQALNEIAKVTPESKTAIKNSIKKYNFLSSIHGQVKKAHSELKNLSLLDNDVLTSRVQPRLKTDLSLSEDEKYQHIVPNTKINQYNEILKIIGEAAWIEIDTKGDPLLNTRSLSSSKHWPQILDDDIIIPGLKKLIFEYNDNSQVPLNNDINSGLLSPNDEATKGINNVITGNDLQQIIQTAKVEELPIFEQPKYTMFLKDAKNELTVTTPNYNLINSINLYDNNSELIPKTSSEYKNISYSSDNNGIIINNGIILSDSQNNVYSVKAVYKEQSLYLKIVLHITHKNDTITTKHIIDEHWKNNSLAKLSGNSNYSKICLAISALSRITLNNKDLQENYLVSSCLIRCILEYSTNAFNDAIIQDSKLGAKSLPDAVSQVIEYLFSKKLISIELKKTLKSKADIESLNGTIHDYNSTLSSIDILSIFNKYKPYLNIIFKELNEKN